MATKEQIREIFYNNMSRENADKFLAEHARRERENDDVVKVRPFDKDLWEGCVLRAYSILDPDAKTIEFNMLHLRCDIKELAEEYYTNQPYNS